MIAQVIRAMYGIINNLGFEVVATPPNNKCAPNAPRILGRKLTSDVCITCSLLLEGHRAYRSMCALQCSSVLEWLFQ